MTVLSLDVRAFQPVIGWDKLYEPDTLLCTQLTRNSIMLPLKPANRIKVENEVLWIS